MTSSLRILDSERKVWEAFFSSQGVMSRAYMIPESSRTRKMQIKAFLNAAEMLYKYKYTQKFALKNNTLRKRRCKGASFPKLYISFHTQSTFFLLINRKYLDSHANARDIDFCHDVFQASWCLTATGKGLIFMNSKLEAFLEEQRRIRDFRKKEKDLKRMGGG